MRPSWTAAHRVARANAKAEAITLLTPSADENATSLWHTASTGAQRLHGAEREGETPELSSPSTESDDTTEEVPSFGQFLHELLSAVDLSGAHLPEVARTLGRAYGHSNRDIAHAIELVRRTLSMPFIEDARRARRVFREVPLAANMPEGRTQAKIDLLFEVGTGWRLDFKTDKAPAPEALKKYSMQVNSYAATLSNVLRAPIVSCVFLVRSSELIECV
jgi:ATP-dependent exoDNAse (exonuclease V) beta subunit